MKEKKNIGENRLRNGNERSTFGLPIIPTLPISSCSFTLKGSFGQGDEEAQRAMKVL
jgi:hypothetical protein